MVVLTPWPGMTMVSGGSVKSEVSIEWMIVAKSPPSSLVLPGPPGNSVSPLNSSGRALHLEADRACGVAGVVDRLESQVADLDDLGIVDEHVVADLFQPRRIGGVDGDLVAGFAHRRHGLDVVPVAVRLEHSAHTEPLAEIEQLLVLVGRVDQHRVARLAAAQARTRCSRTVRR